MSEKPLLAKTIAGGAVQVDLYRPFKQHYLCLAVRGNIYVFPGRSFCTLNANRSNSVINAAKHQRAAITRPPSLELIQDKNNDHFLFSQSQRRPDSVNVVHYGLALHHLQRMHQHEPVQQHDAEHFNNGWREELTIAERYERHRPEFLNMVAEF